MAHFWRWIIVCFFLGQISLVAEFRALQNDFGDSVEAELIELKEGGSIVTLKLRSGLKIDSLVTAFSQADQKVIRKWWEGVLAEQQLLKPDHRITISAKMNRKSNNEMYDKYHWVDDETQSFFPEVVIENDELNVFKGNSVRIVVIAEDKQDKYQKLIVSAETLKADFTDRGKTILESEPFRLRLYEYNDSYSSYKYEYGYEYEGFVVIIKNSAGEITHTRATKSRYLTDMDIIDKCKAGEMYDEDISYKLNTSPSLYFKR